MSKLFPVPYPFSIGDGATRVTNRIHGKPDRHQSAYVSSCFKKC